MTKLEVIKEHRKQYAETLERISEMQEGLEKSVAKHIILTWIKGSKWMGGLSDTKALRLYLIVARETGRTLEEVDAEVRKQMGLYC